MIYVHCIIKLNTDWSLCISHCDCASEWPRGRELGDLACSWWRSAAGSHLHHSPQGFSAPICIIKSKFKKIYHHQTTWCYLTFPRSCTGSKWYTSTAYLEIPIRASLKSILVMLDVIKVCLRFLCDMQSNIYG